MRNKIGPMIKRNKAYICNSIFGTVSLTLALVLGGFVNELYYLFLIPAVATIPTAIWIINNFGGYNNEQKG